MPLLSYSAVTDYPFQPFTKIYSADINGMFTAIQTLLNTTGLDDTNLQNVGITRSTKLKVGTKNAIIINDNSTGAMSELAPGTSGYVLTSSGASAAPSFQPLLLTNSSYQNLGLTVAMSSSTAVVTLTDASLSTPSGSSPVNIAFRNATATSGNMVQRQATAATSITVSSGATLGLVSAQAQYVHIYALDNAGTVELAVAGSRIFDEGSLQSTTAMSAGATSNSVLYSTTSRSNVAVRYIGRFLSNQSTAGTWASAATEVSSFTSKMNAQQRSVLVLANGNGHGSTNGQIRRYSTTVTSTGTAFTYADSSTLGMSVTINEAGLYVVSVEDTRSNGSFQTGASLNASGTDLTTNLLSLANAKIICGAVGVTNGTSAATCAPVYCDVGDVIRAHDDSTANTTGNDSRFTLIKMAD